LFLKKIVVTKGTCNVPPVFSKLFLETELVEP
jgi:hypothetical protein